MSDHVNKAIRDVKLPDWIQEVEDAAAKAAVGGLGKQEASSLFREHAGDLCLKIRQLVVERDGLLEQLKDRPSSGVHLDGGTPPMVITLGLGESGGKRMGFVGTHARSAVT